MDRGRPTFGAWWVAVALLAALTPSLATPVAADVAVDVGADFDGDGIGDHAVGGPGERGGAGAVWVFYGAGTTKPGRQQYWDQATPGVGGVPSGGDAFGASVASGDFDNDGFDDLAIGVPGDIVAGHAEAGSVNVLYGSASGLAATGSEWWHQDRGAVPNAAEPGDHFGLALAAADFDADGRDDLAIGSPDEVVTRVTGAGSVTVLRGCACGLTDTDSQRFTEAASGVQSDPGRGDGFGFALASGRLGGDSVADLVIGAPGETVAGVVAAGGFHVLSGRPGGGLTATGSQLWTERNIGIADAHGAEPFDNLGYSVAAGDLNLDGIDDVAAGAPGEFDGLVAAAGAVFVVYGDAGLLGAAGSQLFDQGTPGLNSRSNRGQEFGHAVLVAPVVDVGGAGADDALVIGVPYDDVLGRSDAGLIHVLAPSAAGVTVVGARAWSLASDGVVGEPSHGAWFGIALGAADIDGDGLAQLLVGSPGEDVGDPPVVAAGALTRLGETGVGPTASGSVHWHQQTPGVAGVAARGDFYAAAFTSW